MSCPPTKVEEERGIAVSVMTDVPVGNANRAEMHRLTRRQRQIIGMIARGMPDKEIAATLGIARTTAEKHVSKLLTRLQVPNRAAAVFKAYVGEHDEDRFAASPSALDADDPHLPRASDRLEAGARAELLDDALYVRADRRIADR